MSDPSEARDVDGYLRAVALFRAMLDDGPVSGVREWTQQFGTHGYSLGVTDQQIDYVREFNDASYPISTAFDPIMMRRWHTINELLWHAYDRATTIPRRVILEFKGLASMYAFPVLEEVSRRVSGSWDEQGYLLKDPTVPLTRQRNSKVRPVSLHKGDRVVDLSHKLVLMKSTLTPAFRATFDSLDKRVNAPVFEGIELPFVTLFERLEILRNEWAHGARFDGGLDHYIPSRNALLPTSSDRRRRQAR